MERELVRQFCLSLPHATESLQWGDDLVFKIGGKMFAVMVLVPARVFLSLKCAEEEFVELTERPGVIPAPYLARNHWIALETHDALPDSEIKRLLRNSLELVLAKLPLKLRSALRNNPQSEQKSAIKSQLKSTNTRRLRRKAH